MFVSSKVFDTGFWGECEVLIILVNFFGKNSNFCDFEKDYTFRFSKQFEKKTP